MPMSLSLNPNMFSEGAMNSSRPIQAQRDEITEKERSTYNKSKTGKFDDEKVDMNANSGQRRNLTAKRSPKLGNVTDLPKQMGASNDYGYDTKKYQIGTGDVETDEGPLPVTRRQGTPDSYSMESINSIEEHVKHQIRESMEKQKNYGSQSSTIDWGLSNTGSKNQMHKKSKRGSTISPSQRQSDRHMNRQQTYASNSVKAPSEQRDSQALKAVLLAESNSKRARRMNDADQRSIQSHMSKTGTLSQKANGEKKDQRIFDVYMKTPYRLMD